MVKTSFAHRECCAARERRQYCRRSTKFSANGGPVSLKSKEMVSLNRLATARVSAPVQDESGHANRSRMLGRPAVSPRVSIPRDQDPTFAASAQRGFREATGNPSIHEQ